MQGQDYVILVQCMILSRKLTFENGQTIENGHMQFIYILTVVMFHSYVRLPEGIFISIGQTWHRYAM